MLFISYFCLVLFLNRSIVVEAIAGGQFISIKDAPYYVGQRGILGNFCGGAIISEYWIITAAHCVGILRYVQIDAGGNVENPINSYAIEQIVVHGSFENWIDNFHEYVDNDIALIKLKNPILFNEYQQPIKMRSKPPEIGDRIIVSGLGHQGNARGNSEILKTTSMAVVSCGDTITDNFFCGFSNVTVSCQGDSGGPVVINGELAGLVSHGTGCRPLSFDGDTIDVYTRVDLYREWIQKHTGIKMDKV